MKMIKLSPKEREHIRMMFGGRCAYCGRELPEKGWHADHVKAIYRGWPTLPDPNGLLPGRGEDMIENLVPACAVCNLFKSVYDLETWREEIAKQVERARKKSSNYRFAEAFGLVAETGKPVVFWFEKWKEEK
jgi:5-methylcytosine-specific restriction endonuclease McrA